MKVALVHDCLNQWGGAERVLGVLGEMFPEAPIYTLIYDAEKLGGHFGRRQVYASFLDSQWARHHHRWFIPLMPWAARSMKWREKYDLIISDSAGFARGVLAPVDVPHVSYCHSPLRYAWERDYVKEKFATWYTRPLRFLAQPALAYLRHWDYQAARRTTRLIANSRFVAAKIRNYYGLDAPVIYPPVDTKFFRYDAGIKRQEYFLAAGRFLSYKRFDLIIDAAKISRQPLKIVGIGPEYEKLRKRAAGASFIEFCGGVSDEELRRIYRQARALIFPQVEDFGLTAAEAVACGTPIIAYAAGGALEIVQDGRTGLFFHQQAPDVLAEAMKKFVTRTWDYQKIADSASKFSKESFCRQFNEALSAVAGDGGKRILD